MEKKSFLDNINWLLEKVNKSNFLKFDEAVPIGRMNVKIAKILEAKNRLVFCHPRVFAKIHGWMKEFPGHPEIDEKYWEMLPLIIYFPSQLLQDNKRPENKLFVFNLWQTGVLVVETKRTNGKENEIATVFLTHPKRLKKYPTIWKEENDPSGGLASPSLLSSDSHRSGGTRFPTLREIKELYNKLDQESQEKILYY